MDFDIARVYKKIGFSEQEQLEDMETHGVSTAIKRAKTLLSFAFNADAEEDPVQIEVKEWQCMFFLSNSWEHDPEGPFKSLRDALREDYFSAKVVHPEIVSSTVSTRVLRKIGRQVISNDGDVVKINGQELVLKAGKLAPMKSKTARPAAFATALQAIVEATATTKEKVGSIPAASGVPPEGSQLIEAGLIDYSTFEIHLKPEDDDEAEQGRLSRYEQFERLEDRLPSGVFKIGRVTEEVDNWRSWDSETHFYLCPLKEGEFTYALLIIGWDDNWENYDVECVSRIKAEKSKSKAEIALIEDWIKTRNIDVSEGSPYLSLLKEVRGED